MPEITQEEPATYTVYRFYSDSRPREIVDEGITLKEAQDHCARKDTEADGLWFDGYERDE